jgi:hypothetical protein
MSAEHPEHGDDEDHSDENSHDEIDFLVTVHAWLFEGEMNGAFGIWSLALVA